LYWVHADKPVYPEKDQYYLEAHGCPWPDGLRVIVASDWNNGHYPAQAYVADFRNKKQVYCKQPQK